MKLISRRRPLPSVVSDGSNPTGYLSNKRLDNGIAITIFIERLVSCSAGEIEAQLKCCPVECLKGLRAVFILSGTTKQLKSWGRLKTCHGQYWRNCVFLHPTPFGRTDLTSLRQFYLRDVLMHEIGHHVDTWNLTRRDRERFAEDFAKIHG